ncbi:MAG: hypothetical protein JKY37_00880, partial [Nannocystaceae bacterium]|nr:hypothetical protein [Nannocystaceae bacterium]
MSALSLEIRNMETEERGEAEFPDAEAALAWLKERPHLIEVLRPVQRDLDPDLEARLRKAMRPLDDAERARRDELDQQRDEKRRQGLQAANRDAIAEERPISGGEAPLMVLEWERGRGLLVRGDDKATVPAEIANAALEWIRERDRWAHSRRQLLATATLTIERAVAGG